MDVEPPPTAKKETERGDPLELHAAASPRASKVTACRVREWPSQGVGHRTPVPVRAWRLLLTARRSPRAPACSGARKPRRRRPPLRAGSSGGARCCDPVRVTWRGRGLSGCRGGSATEHPGGAATRGAHWWEPGGERLPLVPSGAGSGSVRAVRAATERSARPPSPRAGCGPETAWGGGRGRDAAAERRTPGAWSREPTAV